jgi:hypothetical protein
MEFLTSIFDNFLKSIIGRILAAMFRRQVPSICRTMIAVAVGMQPIQDRQRLLEEWLAIDAEIGDADARLASAISVVLASLYDQAYKLNPLRLIKLHASFEIRFGDRVFLGNYSTLPVMYTKEEMKRAQEESNRSTAEQVRRIRIVEDNNSEAAQSLPACTIVTSERILMYRSHMVFCDQTMTTEESLFGHVFRRHVRTTPKAVVQK